MNYMSGAPYAPEHEGGLRYDDPRLGIAWPLKVAEISAKDAGWPLLDESEALVRRRMMEGHPE
jgi:dTDP-4-dehydrorhamnose 3,5-epimerase